MEENIIMKRKYLKKGYNVKKYEPIIEDIVDTGEPLNEKVANLALYMATEFPKLFYFWGGGHEYKIEEIDKLKSLDKDWSKLTPLVFGDEAGTLKPKSFDCSGFVSWCILMADTTNSFTRKLLKSHNDSDGYFIPDSSELISLGKSHKISKHILKIVKRGDFAWMHGHIGIITNIDKEKKTISIAHVSSGGQGMNYTTIDITTGLIIKDDLGKIPKNIKVPNRLNTKYFTHIISVKY